MHALPSPSATGTQDAAPLPKPGLKRVPRKGRRKGQRWPGQGDPEVERVRACIAAREGGGSYLSVDASHRWFGAYQFQLATSNEAARRMHRPELVGVPAHRWSPEDQDAAFYLIYDRGKGKGHWAGGGYPCL